MNYLEDQVKEQKGELEEQRKKTTQLHRELDLLRETVRQSLRIRDDDLPSGAIDRDRETIVWADSMTEATVRDWGTIVSTPLKRRLEPFKQLLIDCGCPAWLAEELAANGHETKWPPGMSSLSVRNQNRLAYSRFKARRLPEQQAVVIMQCENRHMDPSMTLHPGILVLLSHGVE